MDLFLGGRSLEHFNDVGVNRHFVYDAKGQVLDDGLRTYGWTSFAQPSTIVSAATNAETTFSYGSDHERIRESMNSPKSEVLYPGDRMFSRRTLPNGHVEHHYRIAAGGRVVAEHVRKDDGTAYTRFLLSEAQGSTSLVLDQNATPVEAQSFEPWGARRASNWTPYTGAAPLTSNETTAGYTGHEQLDALGLVHMNGRVYDPSLGRFTSADPHVQDPSNAQSFNRYAYVLNNPASGTDPSGYWWIMQFDTLIGGGPYYVAFAEPGDNVDTLYDLLDGALGRSACADLYGRMKSEGRDSILFVGGRASEVLHGKKDFYYGEEAQYVVEPAVLSVGGHGVTDAAPRPGVAGRGPTHLPQDLIDAIVEQAEVFNRQLSDELLLEMLRSDWDAPPRLPGPKPKAPKGPRPPKVKPKGPRPPGGGPQLRGMPLIWAESYDELGRRIVGYDINGNPEVSRYDIPHPVARMQLYTARPAPESFLRRTGGSVYETRDELHRMILNEASYVAKTGDVPANLVLPGGESGESSVK